MNSICFFDIEVGQNSTLIFDIGAVKADDSYFHKNSVNEFLSFSKGCDFICGHNVINHDLVHIEKQLGRSVFPVELVIDTLFLSPLLFPKRPYHHLLKDDKIQADERNNPLNDSIKARDLFFDEVAAFERLDGSMKQVLYGLLCDKPGFGAFFSFVGFEANTEATTLEGLIRERFGEQVCRNSDIRMLLQLHPIALAYALSIIATNDRYSITPPWVLMNFPELERIVFLLTNNPCIPGCPFCQQAFDPIPALKEFYGYDKFRKYANESLQEKAVRSAINNQSLLAIFPTGGGKSLTFQLPALMAGRNCRALTVIISPLRSLMKDQVDNLEQKAITDAVAINGSLDPIERSKSIERVENGTATILYISPESLRSVTIERLLLKRKIARFVIDEAHCFSSWGQDFRVDYLYIGDFIRELSKKKNLEYPIPVSCFTATAKQKVVEDIRNYFREKLGLQLEVFKANAGRTNLVYGVFQKESDEEKYNKLRDIIADKDCPTIVYVSRTRRTQKIAERLTNDGFPAKPYHGKMDRDQRIANQDAFMSGNINIIVATTAFGMGVDKPDVGAVIHYDISDSLENYVQEAGRAGRDESIKADCFVLFHEEDLDKHFILLNQTRINIKEINQVWKAIKDLTRTRSRMHNSALEIARKAGWDDAIGEVETRVTTAIAALEEAGYLQRGQNMPRIYANSILSKTAQDAITLINASEKIDAVLKPDAVRIIRKLFSSKSKRLSTEEAAESRVDYISEQLGVVKEKVIRIIELLREEKILADTKDLTAYIRKADNVNRSLAIVKLFVSLERFLLPLLETEASIYNLKEINERCIGDGCTDCTLARLKTLVNFYAIKNWIKRPTVEGSGNHVKMLAILPPRELKEKAEKRALLCERVTEFLYSKSQQPGMPQQGEEILVEFSVQELKEAATAGQGLFKFEVTIDDIEDTLFYLSRIEAIKIEGGFLVVYNRLSIERTELNNRAQYKERDYEKLKQYYEQRVQQIHIVGEYAKKMIRNYEEALKFVDDYFNLNYSSFLRKYFPGSRENEIRRPLTPEKFARLFGSLSPNQLEIIKDSGHQHIVVAAGPGSGKTRVLVHKLASLLLAEDVKHEQLLMLTFSRAAATEFKKRLIGLIGNAAAYIEIKTFHSFCFDLLGRVGNLQQADSILETAVEKIRSREIEMSRITKAVLVIDEAQDMNASEFSLVKTIMEINEEMRVILVGDDDQNIYEFRGADSAFMQELIESYSAYKYELTENYRSKSNLVGFFNQWALKISRRLKDQPGISVQADNGKIEITGYQSEKFFVPLVNSIQNMDIAGSTCILTQTNEEAMILTGLLKHRRIDAKLIQSNDGFNLQNLYELRYFSDIILSHDQNPLITDEDWSNAKAKLSSEMAASNKLVLANSIIRGFESVTPVRKFKSDWMAFVSESRIEDFERIDKETVFVSTIHKAKGKEFDNVILFVDRFNATTNDAKRKFYVAITRAKKYLDIHYNSNFLKGIAVEDMSRHRGADQFDTPDLMSFSLAHNAVKLWYFEFVQKRIAALHSGASLRILPNGLANSEGLQVVKFSDKIMLFLEEYAQRGYSLAEAKVNYVVYWYDQKKKRELKIILPDIILRKTS